MIETWILIITTTWVSYNSYANSRNVSSAIATVEFNSKATCEAAADKYWTERQAGQSVSYMCVRK